MRRRRVGPPLRVRLRNWLLVKLAGTSTVILNADPGGNESQWYAAVNLSRPYGLIVNSKFDMSRSTGQVRGWAFK